MGPQQGGGGGEDGTQFGQSSRPHCGQAALAGDSYCTLIAPGRLYSRSQEAGWVFSLLFCGGRNGLQGVSNVAQTVQLEGGRSLLKVECSDSRF